MCYIHHKCRDAACRDAQNARERDRRRERAYGTYTRGHVPAGPVREHLNYLGRCGMGTKAVSAATGISYSTLVGIRWGRRSQKTGQLTPAVKVTEAHSRLIRSVQPDLDAIAPAAYIDSRGTVRRLQALAAVGWSLTMLAHRLAVDETTLQRGIRRAKVTATTARAVVALYDELWNVCPPAPTAHAAAIVKRTKRNAAAAGWVPPLAWDNIDTDLEPQLGDSDQEIVDEIAIDEAVAGHHPNLTRTERLIALRRLHAAGHWDATLAGLLSVSVKTIERDRESLGLEANYTTQMKDAA